MILSALLGIALSADKKRQMKAVAEFYDFNEKLIINMKYGRKKFSEVTADYPTVRRALNGEVVIDGENGVFIDKYLKGIGTTDASSQSLYLEEMKVTLAKMRAESEQNYKKYGSMYFKLCLAGGILIAVLLA